MALSPAAIAAIGNLETEQIEMLAKEARLRGSFYRRSLAKEISGGRPAVAAEIDAAFARYLRHI